VQCSPAGRDLIRGFERCRLTAYLDRGGKLTIGWGHTGHEVVERLQWTQAQADHQFERDVAERAESHVNASVHHPLSQGQFDALCSLCFNIGGENFRSSTLVRYLNAGDARLAAMQFVRWRYVKGVVDGDLLVRRSRELWEFARATP
jgi:lysozyme